MGAKFSADRIVELLVKIHTGKLDDGEQEELNAWFAADERNRSIYRRLSDDKYLKEQYTRYKDSENPDGWQELKKRMAASVRHRVLIGRIRRGAIAAAVLLAVAFPLAIVNDWFGTSLRHSGSQYAAPGQITAVIELETGEKILLDQKHDRSVRMLAETGVISGDSILSYDVVAGISGTEISGVHTLYVPKGATTKVVVLSDKTRVWLNAGSSITYPVRFSDPQRSVTIDGECYFDVSHDAERPFVVKTQGVAIQVMGTQFNVMSYADAQTVETTLVCGCVSISASNKEALLKPGVQAVYTKSNHDIALKDVDTHIYTAWKESVFESEGTTIENIAHVLSRWHDVEFVFGSDEVRSMRFNGTIKRDKTLEFILDRISDTQTIQYKIENKKVTIMKK